jgi:glycosyltransferase involved in cell wall biosynthesis
MHILYLHQYFCPPGGAGNNRSLDLARAWVIAGHQVTILSTTAYFPSSLGFEGSSKEFEFGGIKVHALNVDYSHMMGFRARVMAFLKFYRLGKRFAKSLPKPDLIYASSTPPTVGEMGRRLARHWTIPFVFETVDVWPDVPIGMGIIRNPLLASWLHRRLKRIYKEAALIVALSDGMKDQILTHGVEEEKVMVSYNGTNPDAFPFIERTSLEGLHLIYTGTVGQANGVDALVDLSLELERRQIKGVKFTILGGGNDLGRVKAIAEAKAAKNIEFHSAIPKEQVLDWLQIADVGIVTFAPFPVLEANSANKFYDYLATGLPVLINYQGWQAKYLKEYECGLSSKMSDLKALADNVEQMLDPRLRQRMSLNAVQLATRHFDRKVLAEGLLSRFKEILKR